MHNSLKYCKICGLKQDVFPWGKDGKIPSFNICNCCGVEFGYEDATLISIKKYRKEWISSGYKWFIAEMRPKKWSIEKQMKNIPKQFL